jgi:hypothetical protein
VEQEFDLPPYTRHVDAIYDRLHTLTHDPEAVHA